MDTAEESDENDNREVEELADIDDLLVVESDDELFQLWYNKYLLT